MWGLQVGGHGWLRLQRLLYTCKAKDFRLGSDTPEILSTYRVLDGTLLHILPPAMAPDPKAFELALATDAHTIGDARLPVATRCQISDTQGISRIALQNDRDLSVPIDGLSHVNHIRYRKFLTFAPLLEQL